MKRAEITSFSEKDDDFNKFKEKYYVKKDVKKPEKEPVFPSLMTSFSNENKTTESKISLVERESSEINKKVENKIKKKIEEKEEISEDLIEVPEEIRNEIDENFSKTKFFFKYPFRGISDISFKASSTKTKEFQVVLNKLVNLHKKCGPNCEHLRKFFKQIGISNPKNKSMAMSTTVFDRLPGI